MDSLNAENFMDEIPVETPAEEIVIVPELVEESKAVAVVEQRSDDPFRKTLHELVAARRELMHRIDDAEEIDDTIKDLFETAHDLVQGKVDRVAIMLDTIIPSHIEACKNQIENLQKLQERLQELCKEAIKSEAVEKIGPMEGTDDSIERRIMELPQQDRGLHGNAYSLYLSQTPGRLEIDDMSAIPDFYKRIKYSIHVTIDASNQEAVDYWDSFIDQHIGIHVKREVEADKVALKTAIKDGIIWPGAKLCREIKLNIGRAKPKSKPRKGRSKKDSIDKPAGE